MSEPDSDAPDGDARTSSSTPPSNTPPSSTPPSSTPASTTPASTTPGSSPRGSTGAVDGAAPTAGRPFSADRLRPLRHSARRVPVRRRGRTGRWRRVLRGLAALALALLGAFLGVAVAARTTHAIGPVDTEFSASLGWSGPASTIRVAPLGAVQVDSHRGPIRLTARVVQIRDGEARRLLEDPPSARELRGQVERELRSALSELAIRGLIGATIGGLLLGALVFRRPAITLLAGAIALGSALACGGVAAGTWKKSSIAQPRYTGLLAAAPALVGSVDDLANRFGEYRGELAGLVDNVTQLYRTGVSLPVTPVGGDAIRVLHVSDLHLNPAGFDLEETIARQFDVDLILDTGDLTDWGSVPETRLLDRLGRLGRPLVYVRGNHDSRQVQAAVARLPNATVLDGRFAEVAGVRLLGEGDPRFTPDQETRRAPTVENDQVRDSGRRLQSLVASKGPPPPDLVAVHDPIAAEPLIGQVPLVLAGHRHERQVSERDGTVVMVQGSTGGAGLRGLQGEKPTDLSCSVLYLDRTTHRLLAYDDITLGGLGLASATVERHLPPGSDATPPTPAPSGTPTAGPTGPTGPTGQSPTPSPRSPLPAAPVPPALPVPTPSGGRP